MKVSPSHRIYHKLPIYSLTENPNDGTTLENEKKSEGEINWPQGAETILIIAIRHPEDMPALDYWRNPFSGGTEGNLQSIRFNNKIIKWLEKNKNIKGVQFPYVVEQGGICLKDAAVVAGIGAIGKNNMLVTPQWGPRVRL